MHLVLNVPVVYAVHCDVAGDLRESDHRCQQPTQHCPLISIISSAAQLASHFLSDFELLLLLSAGAQGMSLVHGAGLL